MIFLEVIAPQFKHTYSLFWTAKHDLHQDPQGVKYNYFIKIPLNRLNTKASSEGMPHSGWSSVRIFVLASETSRSTCLSFGLLLLTTLMSSVNDQRLEKTAATSSNLGVPTEFLVSLAVAPMLFGVLATDAVFSWLVATGISSEEVFRGERLPVLHFPESEEN